VPKILLVEDNKLTRTAYERSLARTGYHVISAQDGEEALQAAGKENPDLVLLDMMLPKLSGPEVLQRLKSNPETAAIPVIVLTGLSQKNEARLVEDGAAAFVEKNAALDKPEILLSAIRQALRMRESVRENPVFANNTTSTSPALAAHPSGTR
jgi:CheY-like chemotaxis protein